jgi:hypothetical protein
MKIQKSLISFGSLALVAVGSYYLFFQSSDTGENIVAQRSTAELASLKSSSAPSSNEAHVEAQMPLPTDSVAQAHPAGCAHCSQLATNEPSNVSGKTQTVTSEAARPAPIAFTKEVREKLLNHSKGQNIQFTLPGGGTASGVVDGTTDKDGRRLSIEGTLSVPRVGRFLFAKQTLPGGAGDMFGAVYFEEGDVAYSVEPGADGTPVLKEKHVDQVICQSYAISESISQADEWVVEEIPADHPDVINIPTYQNGVIPLSSLPGSLAVVYLDFDGELAPHTGWIDVDAESFNLSNSRIKDLWARTAEEFAPFNINVTTDLQVYLDAPENSRQRCIITPTTGVYSKSAGGVALLNSFNSSNDTACWSFTAGNEAAVVIAHEVGHTLGLSHDGTSISEYYQGHSTTLGKWGPIMGAPFNAAITHWSQGEYADANRTQDDLVIIGSRNNVSLRVDDHGATLATASTMEVLADDSVENGGIIETDADFDAFKFTVTASSSVSLTVSGSSPGQNLDILAEIVDSTDSVVVSDNPDASLNATVAATLAAGDYFLRVTGEGFGDAAGAGFSSYGSLGFYKVTGTVPSAIQTDRFSVAKNSTNTTAVGTVVPRNTHANSVVYSFASGNSSGAFAIDSATGALTVADSALFADEALAAYYEDPVTFELFVDITNATVPALNETVRVVVTVQGNPPVASDTSATLSENDAVGTAVATVSVTDPDAGDTHSYSITANGAGDAFTIDSSGNITTATALNHEQTSSYTLIVTVTDSSGRVDTATVTITVTDVDESAFTGLIAWEDAIHNSAILVEKRTQILAGNASASVDLSAVSGDSSFEFIVEAEDLGQAAVELLRDPSWGLNLEAWHDTNVLGMVHFKVADYSAVAEIGQSVSSPYGSRVHIVYAVDSTAGLTRIYVNGVFVGRVNQLPVIDSANYSTLGSSSNVRNDTSAGIHAFAAYNSVLSPQGIITRYRAWFGASYPVDADGDDLDDAWELTHYGVLGTIDATDDTDGDGYTAFEEMVFGMDPTVNDSGSAPIQGQIVDDGGTDKLQLKFCQPQNFATLNVTYVLQSLDNLETDSWTLDSSVVPTLVFDGANQWVTYLLPLSSGADPHKFYRCKVTVNL